MFDCVCVDEIGLRAATWANGDTHTHLETSLRLVPRRLRLVNAPYDYENDQWQNRFGANPNYLIIHVVMPDC